MNIVIVEDEIRIRNGLKKLIPKINSNYKIVGEAKNGKDGLEIIKKIKPDLVITDVRMPEMDGLEMIKHLIEGKLDFRTIILSAYSDFQYAKKAIRFGVSEYLLKPIDVGELNSCLKNIENSMIIKEKNEVDSKGLFNSLEDILYSLLFRELPLSNEAKEFLFENYHLSEDCEFVEIITYLGENYSSLVETVVRNIKNIFDEIYYQQYCLIMLEQEKAVLIIIFSESTDLYNERWFQYNAMPLIAGVYKEKMCFGWITAKKLEGLKKSYVLLINNLDWNIVLGWDVLISYSEIQKIQTKLLSYPIEIENQMKNALCSLDLKKLETVVKEFIRYFKQSDNYLPQDIKKSYNRFLWSMLNIANELGVIDSSNFEQQEYLVRIKSAILENELTEVLLLLKERFNKEKFSSGDKISFIIAKAKSLMHEFYRQGITLKEIAEKLDITPEYLSMQFNKEIGTNFSSYLTNYRINKAKGLLIGTELKLYEIADLVGYNDAKYFSRVFKKTTGQLPAEYRNIYK